MVHQLDPDEHVCKDKQHALWIDYDAQEPITHALEQKRNEIEQCTKSHVLTSTSFPNGSFR